MERKTRKMVNLAIEETSGVDHPAHLQEGWIVMKAADPSAVDAALTDPTDLPDDAEVVGKEAKSDDAQEGQMEMSTEERLDEALKALEKANARIAEMEKEMASKGEPEMEKAEEEEDMMKSAPESVRKAFEEMQKQADEANAKAAAAEEALRKERDERADAEAVEKARETFAALGIDPTVIGPALRRLTEVDEPLAKAVGETLTAANAKVESADIFTEIGSTPVQTGSAFHKAESMAKAAVADGTAATYEQALSDVFMSDPALYNDYLAEKKG